MLFVPMATRANFCARKFTSLVAFEQLNIPKASGRWRVDGARKPVGGAVERLVPGGGTQHAVVADQRLGQASQSLGHRGFTSLREIGTT